MNIKAGNARGKAASSKKAANANSIVNKSQTSSLLEPAASTVPTVRFQQTKPKATTAKSKSKSSSESSIKPTKETKSTKSTATKSSKGGSASTGGKVTVNDLNQSFDPYGPAVFGVTKFADLSPSQFAKMYLVGGRPSKPRATRSKQSSTKSKSAGVTGASKKSSSVKSNGVKLSLAEVDSNSEHSEGQPPRPPPPPPPPRPTISKTVYANAASDGTFRTIYTPAEIAKFRQAAGQKPRVAFQRFNPPRDLECNWSGLSPIVRDISNCGACYAAVAADLIQTSYFRAFGQTLHQLSAQHMVDCALGAYNSGCSGGSVTAALSWLIDNGVLRRFNAGFLYKEIDYPWRFETSGAPIRTTLSRCQENSEIFSKSLKILAQWSYALYPHVSALFVDQVDFNFATSGASSATSYIGNGVLRAYGYPNGPQRNIDREVLLANRLNELGPLSVTIDGSTLQHYVGGLLDGKGCESETRGNHAMLLVGLGKTPRGDRYWILKNSWSQIIYTSGTI